MLRVEKKKNHLRSPQGQASAIPALFLFLNLSTPATQANSPFLPPNPGLWHVLVSPMVFLCLWPLQLFNTLLILQASAPSSLPPHPPDQTSSPNFTRTAICTQLSILCLLRNYLLNVHFLSWTVHSMTAGSASVLTSTPGSI